VQQACFHPARLAGRIVQKPTQMQRTMHHKMREVMRNRSTGHTGLTQYRAACQQDVAPILFRQRALKRENIGWLVFAAVACIELLNGAVGCEHNTAGATAGAGSAST
jgi:hypothetical protein